MLYPYQDKQTLCVTLEHKGETISKAALNIVLIFTPLSIVPIMLFSMLISVRANAAMHHTLLALTAVPFMCAGLIALIVAYMKLRTHVGEGIPSGETYAEFDSMCVVFIYVFAVVPMAMFTPGGSTTWRIFAITFTTILLSLLTFVAYIISFKFIKMPSRFQMWANRCVMLPTFVGAVISTYAVVSGDRYAAAFVGPMYALLVLSVVCLAVELSAQAYKGREVPVWRYKAGVTMGLSICLTAYADMAFDLLHRFL